MDNCMQCEVRHVVCSACHDKLEAIGNGMCHVCRAATRDGYHWCHAMERLVDCIRVPCPYAAHGCDATPAYHDQESHRQVCPHAPCHCPAESCGFIGSTAALLDHFVGEHNWPCTTKVRAREAFSIRLHDGFNFFLLADHDCGDGEQAAATCCSVPRRLFLLNVTKEQLGRAIFTLCIHPHASAAATTNNAQQLPLMQCELVFSHYDDRSSCHSHYQSSVFRVVCTDLSNGLPNPKGCS
jgi:E3 ubiquitin-protein ligase SIAH1